MTSISIMQPYFIPYSGYFQLLASTDIFVIYDCVQYPRNGWVHRNRMLNTKKQSKWFTLPLKKQPQNTPIKKIQFHDNFYTLLSSQMNKFPVFDLPTTKSHPITSAILNNNVSVVDYLEKILLLMCIELNIPFNVYRSSQLNIPSNIRGADRIIQIAQHFQAKQYINASGGTHLYNHKYFNKHGIQLIFLEPYNGPLWSTYYRLLTENNISHHFKRFNRTYQLANWQ